MLNNTTALTIKEEPGFSCFSSWGTAIATANYLSLFINMLHLVVITSFKSLNTRPHRLILTHLTLVNMASALGSAVMYSCLPVLPLLQQFAYGFPLPALLCEWPIVMYHLVFLIAALEQYYGVRHRVQYTTSRFIRYLHIILLKAWIITFSMQTACLVMATVFEDQPKSFQKAATMGRFTVQYLPLIAAGAMFNVIARELLRTTGSTMTRNQRQNRRISIYFIIICSAFVLTTLVDVVLTCIVIFNPDLISFNSRRLRNLIQPFYGIGIVIIYGIRTESYYHCIQRLLYRKPIRGSITQRPTSHTGSSLDEN